MRRHLCLLAIAVSALVMLAGAVPAAATTGSSTGPTTQSCPAVTIDENPQHNGHNCSTVSRVLWQRWRKSLIGYPGPSIVAGGGVFVFAGRPGQYVGWLYALSRATGATLWGPVPMGGGSGSLAYDNGRLFVAAGGDVVALDPATGRQLWAYPKFLANGELTAAGGRIYFQDAHASYALNESTGALVWSSAGPTDAWGGTVGVDTTGAYVSALCGGRAKLNLSDGTAAWSGDDGCVGGGRGTAILWGSHVYATDGGHVLNKSNGEVVGSFTGEPAFFGTRGYFASGPDIVCRDVSTNTEVWTVHLTESTIGAPVTTGNGLVIVVTGAAHVIGLDAATGKQVFIRTLAPFGPYREGTLSVADGVLIVPSGEGLAMLR